ncbi:MAG: ABC transporter permease [Flavobacteriaceae bacterium]|jgi:putative ABC transport system permease protein|nr:ABC transporter permease [Flavobacteriaceae bacterium]
MNNLKLIFDSNTWQEIFGSIQKNRTRTIITIIGVLWGIFVYIAMSGAAKGLDNGFKITFQSLSINSMIVWAQSTSIPYEGYKTGRRLSLDLADVEALKKAIPEIKDIAPRNAQGNFGTSSSRVVHGPKNGQYTIYADYPDFANIMAMEIYDGGRFINHEDIEQSRKVCVLGERSKAELFDEDEDPIGAYVKIDDVYFQVIGVNKYNNSINFNNDSDIYIPFSTFKKLYNTGEKVGYFIVAAYDDADVVQVEKDVKATLKRRHRVSPDDERAFGGFNLGEIFNRFMGFAEGMTFLSLIVGIATILAGVIGIGNILLISVKERTKEIGVRRALGATPGEVKTLIILESIFLTVVAGIFGIVLGAMVLNAVGAMTEGGDFPYANPTVPIPYVLGAMAIMILLGTLIGMIPAQRAVSIKPIDALREE